MQSLIFKSSLAVLCCMVLAKPALAKCEEELALLDQQGLPAEQLQRNKEWYRAFNSSNAGDQMNVMTEVPQLHLPPSLYSPNRLRARDKGAVSACILRHFAETNYVDMTFFAQEGYAIRLLQGDGVARNPELAQKYLERAARTYRYASASYRLAELQMAGKPTPALRASAAQWAIKALVDAPHAPAESVNPMQAVDLLRTLVDDLMKAKNVDGASALYRAVFALNLPGKPENQITSGHPALQTSAR